MVIRLKLMVKIVAGRKLRQTVKTVMGSMLVIMTTLSGVRPTISGTAMVKLVAIWLTPMLKPKPKLKPVKTVIVTVMVTIIVAVAGSINMT